MPRPSPHGWVHGVPDEGPPHRLHRRSHPPRPSARHAADTEVATRSTRPPTCKNRAMPATPDNEAALSALVERALARLAERAPAATAEPERAHHIAALAACRDLALAHLCRRP